MSMNQTKFSWPDGKRIAVVATAMLEVWSPGKAPSYSIQTTSLKNGQVDHNGIAWSRYGPEVGIWRIIRMLDHFKVKGTIAASAMCTEMYPKAIEQIVKSGHEICGHCVWQDQMFPDMSVDEQKVIIKQSLDMFQSATGSRPVGWKSPVAAFTPETAELLANEGVLWQGDRKDFDQPTIMQTKKGPIVAIPPSEFNDNSTLRGSPQDFFDAQKDTFDFLYKYEPGSLLNITVHCHWGGRPPIMAMVTQLYEYFTSFPDVWFASSADIARWVLKESVSGQTYQERYF